MISPASTTNRPNATCNMPLTASTSTAGTALTTLYASSSLHSASKDVVRTPTSSPDDPAYYADPEQLILTVEYTRQSLTAGFWNEECSVVSQRSGINTRDFGQDALDKCRWTKDAMVCDESFKSTLRDVLRSSHSISDTIPTIDAIFEPAAIRNCDTTPDATDTPWHKQSHKSRLFGIPPCLRKASLLQPCESTQPIMARQVLTFRDCVRRSDCGYRMDPSTTQLSAFPSRHCCAKQAKCQATEAERCHFFKADRK
ncbi:hypothetical protein MRB53_038384 [Persea americana]|nr:hypothetical protein MRB53_038384 [Persea americana]